MCRTKKRKKKQSELFKKNPKFLYNYILKQTMNFNKTALYNIILYKSIDWLYTLLIKYAYIHIDYDLINYYTVSSSRGWQSPGLINDDNPKYYAEGVEFHSLSLNLCVPSRLCRENETPNGTFTMYHHLLHIAI